MLKHFHALNEILLAAVIIPSRRKIPRYARGDIEMTRPEICILCD